MWGRLLLTSFTSRREDKCDPIQSLTESQPQPLCCFQEVKKIEKPLRVQKKGGHKDILTSN